MTWYRNLTLAEKKAIARLRKTGDDGYASTTRKTRLWVASSALRTLGLEATVRISLHGIRDEDDVPLMTVYPIAVIGPDFIVPTTACYPINDIRFEDIRLHPEPTRYIYRYVKKKLRTCLGLHLTELKKRIH